MCFADGRELEADGVEVATRYDDMRTTSRKACGDKIADRCKDVWDLNEDVKVNALSAYFLHSSPSDEFCRTIDQACGAGLIG